MGITRFLRLKLMLFVMVFSFATVPARAESAYNTAFLTDDQLTNTQTMNVSQIQAFLASKGSYLANTLVDVDGVSFSPAQAVADAALQYTINPHVILTTLQKETSSITRGSPPANLGFIAGCKSTTTARQQIACIAERFRSYHNSLISSGQTVSGWQVGVAKQTQDSVSVTPASRAVAGQFTYTPYAGGVWGGSNANIGGVYLFYKIWNEFGFGAGTPVVVNGKTVGIEAGHSSSDPGASSCDGVYHEANITYDVAQRAAQKLSAMGYQVTVIRDNKGSIAGATYDAFVALHVDYCPGGYVSGYKTGRYGGAVGTGLAGNGDGSDRLTQAIWDNFGGATGIPQDHSSGHYTNAFRYYFALSGASNGVSGQTPSAILEMGWMRDPDLNVLVNNSDSAANGVANAINGFLGGGGGPDPCATPSPSADQAAIYADINYCGAYVILNPGDYLSPGALGLANDTASSVKVGSHVKLTLCKDDNYNGGCEDFTANDSSLTDNGIGNDNVSSARIIANDTTTPGGNVLTPANGDMLVGSGTVNFTADAWDNAGGSGVGAVEFHVYYDGQWYQVGSSAGAPYNTQWSIPAGLAAQQLVFTIHVIDNAGNEVMDPGGYHYVNYQPETACPAIQNWKAEYWANSSLSGAALICRDDFAIMNDWGYDAPDPALPVDNFSARWTRTLNFSANTYRFHIHHDDGGRLYVDNQLILDGWATCCAPEQVDVYLAAGSHTIRMETNETGGWARAMLWWEPLYVSGWRGEYYNNQNWIGNPAVVRDDAEINFFWEYNQPDVLVQGDHFSTRWTNTVGYLAGDYRFFIYHDDGSRLTIDGVVRQENLCADCYLTDTADVTLSTGSHAVMLETFENLGYASARLRWLSKLNKLFPSSGSSGQSTAPVLSWQASDGATAYEFCYDTLDNGVCDATWVNNGTNTITSLSGLTNGTLYYWQVRALNDGGQLEADGGVWSSFTTTQPGGGGYSISINAGALYSNQVNVTLALQAPAGTAQMQISNDGGYVGAGWEPFTGSKAWTLTQYANYVLTRVVYVRFMDGGGNVLGACQDDIVLDVNSPTGQVRIVGMAGQPPQGTAVTLNLSAFDDGSGVAQMQISDTTNFTAVGWESFSTTKAWTVGSALGTFVRFRDNAGNISPVYSTVTLSIFLPLGIH